MNKQILLWQIPKKTLPVDALFFSNEWICRNDDMHCRLEGICGKSIWMTMSSNVGAFLFGHLVAEKIERDGKDYILTADPRISFRILPAGRDDWSNWKMQRGQNGMFFAENAKIQSISNVLSGNIKRPMAFSKAKKKPTSKFSDNLGAESAYLKVLRENFYGDLEWPHGDKISPYAALLYANDEIADGLRALDNQIMYILRNGGIKPDTLRPAVAVDAALRPFIDSDLQVRSFIASDKQRPFSMDKTREAEKTHQKILADLRDWIVSKEKTPLCSRSVDMALHADGLFIFEVKSANVKNFDQQGRKGIIQVLEYKMWMEKRERSFVSPILVMSSVNSADSMEYIKNLAHYLGVSVVFYYPLKEDKFPGLEKIVRARKA